MIPDFLLRLSDDSINYNGTGTLLRLTRSAELRNFQDVGKGKILVMRVVPSRAPAPAPSGGEVVNMQLRGTESPYLFTDGTAVVANTPANGFTLAAHGLLAGTPVSFTGTITGITNGTTYFVAAGATLLTNTFAVSTTRANALAGVINNATSAGTTPTITQISTVLAQMFSPTGNPAAPFTINTAEWPSSLDPAAIRPMFAMIRPLPHTAAQPGQIGASMPGIRYLTGYLTFTYGGATITQMRFFIDVTDTIDDSKAFYPSGIVPNIA